MRTEDFKMANEADQLRNQIKYLTDLISNAKKTGSTSSFPNYPEVKYRHSSYTHSHPNYAYSLKKNITHHASSTYMPKGDNPSHQLSSSLPHMASRHNQPSRFSWKKTNSQTANRTSINRTSEESVVKVDKCKITSVDSKLPSQASDSKSVSADGVIHSQGLSLKLSSSEPNLSSNHDNILLKGQKNLPSKATSAKISIKSDEIKTVTSVEKEMAVVTSQNAPKASNSVESRQSFTNLRDEQWAKLERCRAKIRAMSGKTGSNSSELSRKINRKGDLDKPMVVSDDSIKPKLSGFSKSADGFSLSGFSSDDKGIPVSVVESRKEVVVEDVGTRGSNLKSSSITSQKKSISTTELASKSKSDSSHTSKCSDTGKTLLCKDTKPVPSSAPPVSSKSEELSSVMILNNELKKTEEKIQLIQKLQKSISVHNQTEKTSSVSSPNKHDSVFVEHVGNASSPYKYQNSYPVHRSASVNSPLGKSYLTTFHSAPSPTKINHPYMASAPGLKTVVKTKYKLRKVRTDGISTPEISQSISNAAQFNAKTRRSKAQQAAKYVKSKYKLQRVPSDETGNSSFNSSHTQPKSQIIKSRYSLKRVSANDTVHSQKFKKGKPNHLSAYAGRHFAKKRYSTQWSRTTPSTYQYRADHTWPGAFSSRQSYQYGGGYSRSGKPWTVWGHRSSNRRFQHKTKLHEFSRPKMLPKFAQKYTWKRSSDIPSWTRGLVPNQDFVVKRIRQLQRRLLPDKSKLKIDRRFPLGKRNNVTFPETRQLVMINGMLYKSSRQKLVRTVSLDKTANKQPTKSSRPNVKPVLVKRLDTRSMKTVTVRGVRFKMDAGGKTLKRVSTDGKGPSTSTSSIKSSSVARVDIGGVTYIQTKPGTLEKLASANTRVLASRVIHRSLATVAAKSKKKAKTQQYCMFYNRFGKCKRGDKCPFIHDPEKVAVCTRFLRGTCKVKGCLFSHKADKDKMPVCSFFLRGVCNHDDCPYLHVNVSRDAEICADFVKGYCALGAKCKKKHILDCPSFARTGTCPDGTKCRLLHRQKQSRKRRLSGSITTLKSELRDVHPMASSTPYAEPATNKQRSEAENLKEEEDDSNIPFKSRKLPAFIALGKSPVDEANILSAKPPGGRDIAKKESSVRIKPAL